MRLVEAPAGSRARQGRGQELVLRATTACNQRCPFCFVERGPAPAWTELEAELDALARRPGPKGELTLSGGEPAADPRLLELLDAARARGFRAFALQTNAVPLARPGLVAELVRRGVRTYMVSLHSHRPAAYDLITGSRGQLGAAVVGLSRLLEAGVRVSVSVVVNRANHRDLPALMGFLGRLALGRPLAVCLSMINEVGHEKAPALAVDLASVRPHLRAAVARARRAGLTVERFAGGSALPVCLLAEPAGLAGGRAPQERVRYAERVDPSEAPVGRVKRPDCRRCAHDPACLGVPARYAALFGLRALRPVEAHG